MPRSARTGEGINEWGPMGVVLKSKIGMGNSIIVKLNLGLNYKGLIK